ncbi:MAG TPA: NDP-sugar synthase [Acidimicrobiales bacterium]|nr:NDP-sugar synthase [Acidimicrobiales bacterium]
MKAVVLVGGEGTRLRPLTLTTPKQMLPVGGRPMIERVLEGLAVHGIDEVVLSLGYRPDAFIEAYPDGKCAGVRLQYAVEPEPLDTAGAISFAARHAGLDEVFVVVNGDVLTDLDVSALIEFHKNRDAEATIALTPVEDPSRFGVVPTDPDGRVIAFIEKPPPGEAPTNLINAGTYVLEPSVLARIPTDRKVSIERETFPAIVAEGRLFAMASDADWVDAGTPATFLAANLRHAGPPPGSCRIDDGATVRGSVLGDDVRVGQGATVEGSVLFDGATVAEGARVSSSVVGRGARIGEGADIGELSVLGDGVTVAAGTVLRGARIPEVS